MLSCFAHSHSFELRSSSRRTTQCGPLSTEALECCCMHVFHRGLRSTRSAATHILLPPGQQVRLQNTSVGVSARNPTLSGGRRLCRLSETLQHAPYATLAYALSLDYKQQRAGQSFPTRPQTSSELPASLLGASRASRSTASELRRGALRMGISTIR